MSCVRWIFSCFPCAGGDSKEHPVRERREVTAAVVAVPPTEARLQPVPSGSPSHMQSRRQVAPGEVVRGLPAVKRLLEDHLPSDVGSIVLEYIFARDAARQGKELLSRMPADRNRLVGRIFDGMRAAGIDPVAVVAAAKDQLHEFFAGVEAGADPEELWRALCEALEAGSEHGRIGKIHHECAIALTGAREALPQWNGDQLVTDAALHFHLMANSQNSRVSMQKLLFGAQGAEPGLLPASLRGCMVQENPDYVSRQKWYQSLVERGIHHVPVARW